MPLFSVIIPVYNRAKLVGATLDSIFAQELEDQEIILVDDGSTDDTAAILASYGDRVRVFRQANAGPGAARNLGIRHAVGEYVAFMDSDDLWFPWTLAVFAEAIERFNRPAVLGGAILDFTDEREVRGLPRAETKLASYPDYFATSVEGLYFGTSLVIRRDVLTAMGGFTDRRINAEDHDLLLRLGTAPGFVNVASPPTRAWRRHPQSATGNPAATVAGTRYLVEQEEAGQYPGGSARRGDRRRIIGSHVRSSSVACARAGDSEAAWWFYRHTFSWQLRAGRFRYLLGLPWLARRGANRALGG